MGSGYYMWYWVKLSLDMYKASRNHKKMFLKDFQYRPIGKDPLTTGAIILAGIKVQKWLISFHFHTGNQKNKKQTHYFWFGAGFGFSGTLPQSESCLYSEGLIAFFCCIFLDSGLTIKSIQIWLVSSKTPLGMWKIPHLLCSGCGQMRKCSNW